MNHLYLDNKTKSNTIKYSVDKKLLDCHAKEIPYDHTSVYFGLPLDILRQQRPKRCCGKHFHNTDRGSLRPSLPIRLACTHLLENGALWL